MAQVNAELGAAYRPALDLKCPHDLRAAQHVPSSHSHLHLAYTQVDVELRAAERHALDCALAVEELRAAAAARQAVALSSEKLVEARSRTSTLLQEARKAQEAALKEYETLAGRWFLTLFSLPFMCTWL